MTHPPFHNRSVARAALLASACAVGLSIGCKKEAPESHEAAKLEVSVPSGLAAAQAELTATVRSYEGARAALAADRIADVSAPATELTTVATAAALKLTGLREPLTDLAEASSKLEKMPKQDAEAVREAFGEVSRAYVSLLAKEPALQSGLHVFECPMAQGYKQWVQPGEKMENPYMGTRMLECGVPGKWE